MEKIYGYPIDCGYLGWVEELHRYQLFETEGAYLEYLKENKEQ